MVVVLFLLSFLAHAADTAPRHQLTFGNTLGIGWSTSSNTASGTSLGIKDFKVQTNNFSGSYAYRIVTRWQVGAAVQFLSDEQDLKLDGGSIETEVRQSHFFVFLTYNFSENLQTAYYLSALVGRQHFEHASNDKRPDPKNEIDLEYDLTTYGLTLGKRFLLRRWEDVSISYAPAISYFCSDAGGDLANDGLDDLTFLRFDLIRFDILI